jgi:hypothetical protein
MTFSGEFQETTSIDESGNITFKEKHFEIDKDQEYIFIKRIKDRPIYDWGGNILGQDVIDSLDVGGRIRIQVGFQDNDWENLYFTISQVVDKENGIYKGIGLDIYGPYHTEFIDKEFEFCVDNIVEIWFPNKEQDPDVIFLKENKEYLFNRILGDIPENYNKELNKEVLDAIKGKLYETNDESLRTDFTCDCCNNEINVHYLNGSKKICNYCYDKLDNVNKIEYKLSLRPIMISCDLCQCDKKDVIESGYILHDFNEGIDICENCLVPFLNEADKNISLDNISLDNISLDKVKTNEQILKRFYVENPSFIVFNIPRVRKINIYEWISILKSDNGDMILCNNYTTNTKYMCLVYLDESKDDIGLYLTEEPIEVLTELCKNNNLKKIKST